jgi:hypothetical protein
MDSSDQRKVRKNMEEINPTESSGLSESPGLLESSSELLSPESTQALEKAYALDVATGGCKSCQSTWKPTRRQLVQAVVATLIGTSVAVNSSVATAAVGTPECDDAYDRCEEIVAKLVEEGKKECARRRALDPTFNYGFCIAQWNIAKIAGQEWCYDKWLECEEKKKTLIDQIVDIIGIG